MQDGGWRLSRILLTAFSNLLQIVCSSNKIEYDFNIASLSKVIAIYKNAKGRLATILNFKHVLNFTDVYHRLSYSYNFLKF